MPSTFDPKNIERYTAFNIYFEFGKGEPPGFKYFVALKHDVQEGIDVLWSMKATSNTAIYEGSDAARNSCVWYEAGELDYFPAETAIQPNNFFPIFHDRLRKENEMGRLRILGKMPDDFHEKICAATRSCYLLNKIKKTFVLALVDEKLEP